MRRIRRLVSSYSQFWPELRTAAANRPGRLHQLLIFASGIPLRREEKSGLRGRLQKGHRREEMEMLPSSDRRIPQALFMRIFSFAALAPAVAEAAAARSGTAASCFRNDRRIIAIRSHQKRTASCNPFRTSSTAPALAGGFSLVWRLRLSG